MEDEVQQEAEEQEVQSLLVVLWAYLFFLL
jgi:hypothetical protein